MQTGLFFGTFNPVHHGHLMIANYMQQFTTLDEIWFVLTPQSPFKTEATLLPGTERLHMLQLAVGKDKHLKVSDVEFGMPKPNYTIKTLEFLTKKHPDHEFVVLTGSDNLMDLHKWHRIDDILAGHKFYVYRRPGFTTPSRWEKAIKKGSIKLFDAPQLEISAGFIRKSMAEGKNLSRFLPENVYLYITENGFYES
ncbi:MAG: nicotinate-nucleotide adenylyltransferase [Bacteroidota bacterium]